MPVLPYLKVKVATSGILAMRTVPESKMRNALILPPPSTLIGALAYPLFRLFGDRTEIYKGKSRADELRKIIFWTTVKIDGKPKVFGQILKVNRFYRGNVDRAITSLPISIYYSQKNISIDILYVFDGEALSESPFTMRLIQRAGWGIARIGSRESVVSVEDVEMGEVKLIKKSSSKTKFAFPLEDKKVRGSGTVLRVFDWRAGIGDYTNVNKLWFFYPDGECEVSGDLKVLDVGEEVVL